MKPEVVLSMLPVILSLVHLFRLYGVSVNEVRAVGLRLVSAGTAILLKI